MNFIVSYPLIVEPLSCCVSLIMACLFHLVYFVSHNFYASLIYFRCCTSGFVKFVYIYVFVKV